MTNSTFPDSWLARFFKETYTEECFDTLEQLTITCTQGYGIHRPMEIWVWKQFTEWLLRSPKSLKCLSISGFHLNSQAVNLLIDALNKTKSPLIEIDMENNLFGDQE